MRAYRRGGRRPRRTPAAKGHDGKRLVAGSWDCPGGTVHRRVGVVSLPAVEVGLDLDQRVIRRHVAKLEAAGWLARAPWIWGEGSWPGSPGSAPSPPGSVACGRSRRRRRRRRSATPCSWDGRRRGSSAVGECGNQRASSPSTPSDGRSGARRARLHRHSCPTSSAGLTLRPGRVIAESGGRREDRQKMILEGWREAIWSGRYTAVRYDCATASVAHWIARLAKKVWLIGPEFSAAVQKSAAEIAVLPAVADDDGEDEIPNERQQTPPARSPPLNRATSPRLRLHSPQSPWRRRNPRRICWHLKRRRPQPSGSGATARSSVCASQGVADPGDDEGAQAHRLQASEYRAVASGFPHPDRTFVGRRRNRRTVLVTIAVPISPLPEVLLVLPRLDERLLHKAARKSLSQ